MEENKNKDIDIYVKFSQQMGRLPIFLPTNERKPRQEVFECPWGAVKITGVSLTTLDEDILYTLCQIGERSYVYLPEIGQINTIHFKGTYYDLYKAMGRKFGTSTIEQLKASLEALSTTHVGFVTTVYDPDEKKKKDRKKTISSSKPLIYEYATYDEKDKENRYKLEKGQFYVVISEAVSKLLLFSKTLMNISVKKQLPPLLQALYRFALSHIVEDVPITFKKLHQTIAPNMEFKKFKYLLTHREDLRQLFLEKTNILYTPTANDTITIMKLGYKQKR